MKIEKIELNGFKSFSDKTPILTHHGITCIVGPNGSGKSNIFDAFRWVLGEQSAKNLRGDKMEEIIFNGSSQKKPKGMAEVTLYMSDLKNQAAEANGNGSRGSRKDDICTVSRRLFRSGESEYLINNKKSRLKDIRDIFLDTGMEVKSYSFIEQGRISEILEAKPLERRFLIEEVAGVMKYKVKKAEAQAKLDLAAGNLTRVNDLTEEVKRSLNSLERQVKKALKYKELSQVLRLTELKIAKRDYSVLVASLHEAEEHIKNYGIDLERLKEGLMRLEDEKEERATSLLAQKAALDKLIETQQAFERDISKKEKEIAVWDNEQQNMAKRIDNLSSLRVDYDNEGKGALIRINEIEAHEVELKKSLASMEEVIAALKGQTGNIEADFNRVESEVKERHGELFKVSERYTNLSNEINNISNMMQGLRKKIAAAVDDLERANRDASFHTQKQEDTQAKVIQKENTLKKSRESREVLAGQLEICEKTIEQMRKDIQTVREALASNRARLSSLEEITSNALRIEEMERVVNIVSPLPHVLNVPAEYEVAVESALSVKLSGFIVSDKEEIKKAVSFVQEKKGQKRAFMAVELSGCSVDNGSRGTSPHGALSALDIVQTDTEYSALARALLSGIYIVDDIDTAFNLRQNGTDNCSYMFATKDGVIVEPSGAVIIGKAGELLKHTRQIRTLKEDITTNAEKLQGLEVSFTKVSEERKHIADSIKENDRFIINLDKEVMALREEVKKHAAEGERLRRKVKYIETEKGENEKELGVLTTKHENKKIELDTTGAKKQELNQQIERLREQTAQNKLLLEKTRSSLHEKQMEHTRTNETLRSLEKERLSTRKRIESVEKRLGSTTDEVISLEAKIQGLKTTVEHQKEEVQGLSVKLAQIKEEVANEKEKI
ncbi:MAG: AAA family ATPase, partial [Candidatus Magnetoovum sp. WYHC-5]|nr:AAA family ATPase [Candidatus Magnetoovum sp. WYHC-5]